MGRRSQRPPRGTGRRRVGAHCQLQLSSTRLVSGLPLPSGLACSLAPGLRRGMSRDPFSQRTIYLESTEFQPVSQLYFPRFAWSSDCASIRSRGCTAVLELLATPARAIIIAADPGRRALPGGAAQEKIDVREIFGLVRFYTDDYLPMVFFTKRDDLFAFGHRLHTNYRRPFIGSQLRHSGFSLRVSNSSLSACPRFCNLHGQP